MFILNPNFVFNSNLLISNLIKVVKERFFCKNSKYNENKTIENTI